MHNDIVLKVKTAGSDVAIENSYKKMRGGKFQLTRPKDILTVDNRESGTDSIKVIKVIKVRKWFVLLNCSI